MTRHVIVVEDDASIGQAMRDALVHTGYRVDWCTTGAAATSTVAEGCPDLMVLDAGLPDVDGFALCRLLREQHPKLPIMLVTARDAVIDVVVGLDAGASDYVTKPFSMSVLLARIRAHLRDTASASTSTAIQVGGLRVEPDRFEVTLDGEPIELRRREFELLVYLCQQADRVVTRERLLSHIWDLHWETSSKTLDMHVVALRRKLGDRVEIATVRGVGYRLVDR